MKHDVSQDPISADDLKRLYRTVARRCPSRTHPADIQDIVSEMLLDATKASSKTGIPITPLAFLNAKRQRFYVRAAGRIGSLRDITEEYEGPFADTIGLGPKLLLDETPDPFDMIAKVEIDDIMERMAESLADALTLHLRDDLTLAETAECLGVTTNAAFVRVQKGKALMKEVLAAADAA